MLWDDNGISIDGAIVAVRLGRPARRASPPPAGTPARVDGHDPDAIARGARRRAGRPTKPALIACKTIIGFGAPTKAGTASTPRLAARRRRDRRRAQGSWAGRTTPFEVPDDHRSTPGAPPARAAPAQRAAWAEAPRRQRRRARRVRPRHAPAGCPTTFADSRRRLQDRHSPKTRRRSPPASPRRRRST
ncbi:MAG: hypothetical protein V9G14_11195 [Cypionkella sp.]